METRNDELRHAPHAIPVSPGRAVIRSASARELSVIVVNWNTRDLLRNCIRSIQEHLGSVDHEILVVDNASTDGSPDMVASEFSDVRLLRNPENVGFGAANNEGMRHALGRWFLLLNSDAQLLDGSVAELLRRARDEGYLGVAQCRLRLPDGRLQHSAYRFPSLRLAALEDLGVRKLLPRRRSGEVLLGQYWDHAHERDVDWVAGAFMLLPREVFARTGGFDERLFMYGEDLEWCYRIRWHGWPIRYFPDAQVLHHDHASAEKRFGSEREALCLQRRQEFYVDRNGRVAGTVYMAVRLVGAALRAAYYAVRGEVGGRRSAAYRDMQPDVNATLRAMLALALGRR